MTMTARDMLFDVTSRCRKVVSRLKPYEAMRSDKAYLDAQYARGSWDYLRSAQEAPRFGIVSSYCNLYCRGGSILEIGCGDGILVEQLDQSRYAYFSGIDISQVAIDRAASLQDERTRLICADAESYTPDRKFDMVVFNEVLEYFGDPLGVVTRYQSFISPGGHFIVSMFAGVDTATSRQIWKKLESGYSMVAHSKVTTRPRYLWNVKVFRAQEL